MLGLTPARSKTIGRWIGVGLLGGVNLLSVAEGDEPPRRGGMLDLTRAVVAVPKGLDGPESKAVAMLVEEVERRTQIRWKVDRGGPRDGSLTVAVGTMTALIPSLGPSLATRIGAGRDREKLEGFRIGVDREGPTVFVAGNDPRGVLFGVGRLLRELRMTRGRVLLPDGFRIETAPEVAIRGHQLGYRPKTNSYDAWDLPQWERYIRDLAAFGTNAVELIPPRSDDDADSPHFPRPPIEMMAGMSQILDDYGLDVWIWYPAMDKDYSDPKTVAHALEEWGEVFRKLPRVDAVFVPGGDPGHTRPKDLMALLEKEAEVLRRYHPKAQMWVSPQSFSLDWYDEFIQIVARGPDWLGGVVHGPQVRVSLPELRAAIPARYPIRRYPDITHSRESQYPVPDWDLAFALTEAREVINPRPTGQATIFRTYKDHAVGFLTYSEGCNDDVNKIVWSGLGWDPDAKVEDILRQYARYFISDRFADGFAQGLLALERNWSGPLLTNASVDDTLAQFQDMEHAAGPREKANWRFQQALYRAYYDAFLRDRLLHETRLEAGAMQELRAAKELGTLRAMERAATTLDRAVTEGVSADRRARVFELAEALFQSIGMQLSVDRYGAIDVGRGANLDTIDVPLNNRFWLQAQFAELRKLGAEADRLKGLDAIVRRTDPGPGGFYDDLGDPSHQPHLVRGPGFATDPAFLRSSLVGFSRLTELPTFWPQNAQILNDTPPLMRYTALDPEATYKVRVVYVGDPVPIKLEADEDEVHPFLDKPPLPRPLEFDVPPPSTADGALTLRWTKEPGKGGNGRGTQVAEVWLIRKE